MRRPLRLWITALALFCLTAFPDRDPAVASGPCEVASVEISVEFPDYWEWTTIDYTLTAYDADRRKLWSRYTDDLAYVTAIVWRGGSEDRILVLRSDESVEVIDCAGETQRTIDLQEQILGFDWKRSTGAFDPEEGRFRLWVAESIPEPRVLHVTSVHVGIEALLYSSPVVDPSAIWEFSFSGVDRPFDPYVPRGIFLHGGLLRVETAFRNPNWAYDGYLGSEWVDYGEYEFNPASGALVSAAPCRPRPTTSEMLYDTIAEDDWCTWLLRRPTPPTWICDAELDGDARITYRDIVLLLQEERGMPLPPPEAMPAPRQTSWRMVSWNAENSWEVVYRLHLPTDHPVLGYDLEVYGRVDGRVSTVRLAEGLSAGRTTHDCDNPVRVATASAEPVYDAAYVDVVFIHFDDVDAPPELVIEAGSAASFSGQIYTWPRQTLVLDRDQIPTRAPAASLTTALHQNRPNPFNPATTIRFDLAAPGRVSLHIFDAAGRLVCRLQEGWLDAGEHSTLWHGRDDGGREMASGVYWCRLKTSQGSWSSKLVMLR